MDRFSEWLKFSAFFGWSLDFFEVSLRWFQGWFRDSFQLVFGAYFEVFLADFRWGFGVVFAGRKELIFGGFGGYFQLGLGWILVVKMADFGVLIWLPFNVRICGDLELV